MSTVGDRISDNLRDSVAAVGEVAYAERAQFMAAHRAELQRLATELDRIRAVAENATGEAKESAAKAVEGIRAKLEAARQELDLAQQATEDSWHNTSSKLAASYDAVVDSLAETRTWAAEKIAPPGMGVSPDRKSEGQRPGG